VIEPAPAENPIRVDLVIPVYNEEEAAPIFHQHLRQALESLPYCFQIIYVNDGSSDGTASVLEQITRQDERVEVIELSRNFGHQAALTAGLDASLGDFVITMDGDGQHPPELISELLQLAQSGYDVVLTQRNERASTSLSKKLGSNLFYRLINQIGDTQILPGSADFRLLRKPVVESLRSMREYHRLLRGMVAWAGYKTVILPYDQPERIGGKSKYSPAKMLRLALDAVFSFSLVPLYIAISVGLIFLVLALAEMIYVLSFWVTGRQAGLAPGWSSLMFVLLVVGGSLMVALGLIGVYVGYIFQEVKRRPIYFVRRVSGASADNENPSASGGALG
jgi:polyisoprenyl-phosphate glycosyltransferase